MRHWFIERIHPSTIDTWKKVRLFQKSAAGAIFFAQPSPADGNYKKVTPNEYF